MEDRLLLRTREAADVLGISRTKLYELIAAGELPSVQIDSSRRLHVADLEAFAERLRTQHLPQAAAAVS